MPAPKVKLVNIFARAYDNFLATARTCYSASGIVEPEALAVDEEDTSEEAQRRRERKRALAQSLFEAGHHTTLQHAHVQFALDGVSRQFIWSFLHSHPFYNSEQVSQRYVSVSRDSFYVPEGLSESGRRRFEAALQARMDDYYSLCDLLREPLAEDYYARFSGRRGTKRAQVDIQRRAQEIARYVLPVATVACLYHTVSLITLLRYWRLANEFDAPAEQRLVVGAMVEAVLEREPQLRSIVQEPLALEDTPEYAFFADRAEEALFSTVKQWEVDVANARAFTAEFDAELGGATSRLADFGARNEQVLADAVREVLGVTRGGLSDDAAIALLLDPGQNRLFGEPMNLAMHSKLGRTLFHARYTFRKRLSHAADSQDQRHRTAPGSRPILMRHYTGAPDYYLPAVVAGHAQARERYERGPGIGAAAGVRYPHIAALSELAATVSVEDDFDGGLRMLIAGIEIGRAHV